METDYLLSTKIQETVDKIYKNIKLKKSKNEKRVDLFFKDGPYFEITRRMFPQQFVEIQKIESMLTLPAVRLKKLLDFYSKIILPYDISVIDGNIREKTYRSYSED
jgi:hypothetical protein